MHDSALNERDEAELALVTNALYFPYSDRMNKDNHRGESKPVVSSMTLLANGFYKQCPIRSLKDEWMKKTNATSFFGKTLKALMCSILTIVSINILLTFHRLQIKIHFLYFSFDWIN